MAARDISATGNDPVTPPGHPTQYRVAIVLTVINLLGLGWAVGRDGEPSHTLVHGTLAVVFGLWALRLRQAPAKSEPQPAHEDLKRLTALETELGGLQRDLGEMHERLDFVERLLAQGPEARRMGS